MKIIEKRNFRHEQLKNATTGELYSLSQVVSDSLKSKQLFFHHDIIAPSRRSSGAHRHSESEEVVYVIKGTPTVYCGDQKTIIDEGSFVIFDPKDNLHHYLINETSTDVETLTFSVNKEKDYVIYEENYEKAPLRC